MARNIEIKARVADLAPIRAIAATLTPNPAQLILQKDTFFVVPRGRLKIREFADGSGELISYERADRTGPKESVYSKATCPDARGLAEVLGSVLAVRGVVAKRRELFLVGRTRVHLDEVADLGCFVELEVVMGPDEPSEQGDREARRLLVTLGVPDHALVAEAYIDLLEAAAG